ncbi:MAG: hypothetical protein JNL70_23385 [Saprospiraceae bacterium]|nr:hypothetical protein [Saprospiraceae bacterium]
MNVQLDNFQNLIDTIKLYGDKLQDYQLECRQSFPTENGELAEAIINRIKSDNDIPFYFETQPKNVSRLSYILPNRIATAFNYETNRMRLDVIKGGMSELTPKKNVKNMFCRGIKLDGAGQFWGGNPNWSLVRTVKIKNPISQNKEIVASIVYSPQDRTLFYSIDGESFSIFKNNPPIKMNIKNIDIDAALIHADHRIEIEPVKIKAHLGNHHRGPATLSKCLFQEQLGRRLHLSFQDLSSMNYPLCLMAQGVLGVVYIGSAESNLKNCSAGIFIAENAGYSVSAFHTSSKTGLDKMQNRRLCSVIGSQPQLHSICLDSYKRATTNPISDIGIVSVAKRPNFKLLSTTEKINLVYL